MESTSHFNKLKCIQFPGVVQNPRKAFECLGGLRVISKACESQRGCLELNFRPKDPFCKPALSTFTETTGLLLKIKVKKKKTCNGENNRRVISTEILGIVHEIYTFQTLTDYQYLPAEISNEPSASNNTLKCILNDIYPSTIPSIDWLEKPSPYFFVPPIFSRITAPQAYSFNDTQQNEGESEAKNINLLIKSRKSRSNYAFYINFNHTEPIPTVPKKQAIEMLKKDNECLKKLREIFNEKPIRGRIELKYLTNFQSSDIKIVLAAVAYNYINGPWRGLWVKLGYDPRKDPKSRIWQCIDYRVKALGVLSKQRRNINYSYTPIKDGRPNMRKSNLDKKSDVMDERLYIFKPDILPIKTQTFYQFCHIYVPEIQEMFSNLGEVLPGALCHEKRGWLPSGFYKQCRLIMSKYTLHVLRHSGIGKQNADPSTETSQKDEIQSEEMLLMDVEDNDYEDAGTLMDDEEYEGFPESDEE